MAALLRDRAADLADAPFLLAAGEAWSFSDAAERAARRAGTLRATGVEPGDRVVALLPNGPLIVELLLACAWSGAVLVPVNTASRGPQLAHVIGDCEPKLVVADAAFVEELASVVSIENGSTPLWVAGDPSVRSASLRAARPHPSRSASHDRAIRSRSSTPRGRPGRRRASSARTLSSGGGATTPVRRWGSPRVMCSSPASRSSTRTP